MSSKYKKMVLYFFLIIFSILIILKYSISILKNEILNIIKSDQFDTFIVNIIDQKVEKLAESKITSEKKKFYKENLNKILDKFDFK